MGEPRGVLIVGVTKASVGERTGLQQGDVILKYGDKVVNSPTELLDAGADTSPGTAVPITIWRQGSESVVKALF